MRLNVWPACIECAFIKLDSVVFDVSKYDEILDEWTRTKSEAIECIHAPVCSHINGQKKIEGGNDAPVA